MGEEDKSRVEFGSFMGLPANFIRLPNYKDPTFKASLQKLAQDGKLSRRALDLLKQFLR